MTKLIKEKNQPQFVNERSAKKSTDPNIIIVKVIKPDPYDLNV